MKLFKRKSDVEVVVQDFDMEVEDVLYFIDNYNLSFEDVGNLEKFMFLSDKVDPMLFYRINGVIKYPK